MDVQADLSLFSLLLIHLFPCQNLLGDFHFTFQDSIKSEVATIKTLLASHHKLMSDIRAILKTLAKVIFLIRICPIKNIIFVHAVTKCKARGFWIWRLHDTCLHIHRCV